MRSLNKNAIRFIKTQLLFSLFLSFDFWTRGEGVRGGSNEIYELWSWVNI